MPHTADERAERLPRTVYRWAQRTDNLSLCLLDVGVVCVAWFVAYVAGFETRNFAASGGHTVWLIGVPLATQILVNRLAGLYGPVWRYASVEEAVRVVLAVAGGAVLSTAAVGVIANVVDHDLPFVTTPAVALLLMLLGSGGIRFQSRLFALERQQVRVLDRAGALIVGAGSAGVALAYELEHTDAGKGIKVVGFVDDDPALIGRTLRGIPVLGHIQDLEMVSEAHDASRIFIVQPKASNEQAKAVVERALRTKAQVQVLPSAAERVGGPLLRSVRDLDVTDLLGRAHAPVDSAEIADYLEGATVLITGAGGSIGSEISRQVASYGPAKLLLLDRDETLLHDVLVGTLADAQPVLADIGDPVAIGALFERHRPDVVFHAAAHKHVPLLEQHPVEAVRTNVLGTWRLATLAAEHGCRRFVHISTDKAADPCSVMGATKRAAEQVVFEVGRRRDLPFVAVRFGNVLGSRGSVVPTFLRQILDGGPVTVTSPEMTRFFMTIPEAVSLVLQSGAMAEERKIFLLDMGEPVSIVDLATQMIRLAGLRPHHDIEIKITGIRPGERIHERLHDDAEVIEPADHPSISALEPKVTWEWHELVRTLRQLEAHCARPAGRSVSHLLEAMLRRGGVECTLDHAVTELAQTSSTNVQLDLRDPDEVLDLDAEVLDLDAGVIDLDAEVIDLDAGVRGQQRRHVRVNATSASSAIAGPHAGTGGSAGE